MAPVNLYFTPEGKTALRYRRQGGEVAERIVDFPAALLTQAPDPQADVDVRPFETANDLVFAAFRAMPLRPELNWRLAEGHFGEHFQRTFQTLLKMLRMAPERRWSTRGEPGEFLQFGLLEEDGSYTMGAFTLPSGRPFVLTFRPEDMIERLPLARPFATLSLTSSTDALPPRTDPHLPWDTRLRLPLPGPASALLHLAPEV